MDPSKRNMNTSPSLLLTNNIQPTDGSYVLIELSYLAMRNYLIYLEC